MSETEFGKERESGTDTHMHLDAYAENLRVF